MNGNWDLSYRVHSVIDNSKHIAINFHVSGVMEDGMSHSSC